MSITNVEKINKTILTKLKKRLIMVVQRQREVILNVREREKNYRIHFRSTSEDV